LGAGAVTQQRQDADGDARQERESSLKDLKLKRVPIVRPLSVERARELLGAEAVGLTDVEVHEVACAVARHVSLAFDLAFGLAGRDDIQATPAPGDGADPSGAGPLPTQVHKSKSTTGSNTESPTGASKPGADITE
jgi:hypothetical protein